MALPSHYDTGTVTVANGGTAVTGVGTGWNGVVFAGDLLHDPAQGIVARIAADATSDTALTLANGWPGTALSGDAYEILFTADSVRASERTRQLLEGLSVSSGMLVAVSDETNAISSGAGKLTFRSPNALQLTEVRASLKTASSSGAVQVDVNVNGTSIFSTPITIDEGEKTSVTAAVAAVMSSISIEDDDEITIDIDDGGSGAVGLKVTFIGTAQT